jgi:predicted regulator of Ras-like GTPase activity (Roadblock/LC7/MglB family)
VPSKDIEIFNKNFLKKNYVFFIPPGQEDLRVNEYHGTMKIEYFSNVSTFIFVIDSSDAIRFREAQAELQRSIEDLLELSPNCQNFLLFTHKQDLQEAKSSLEIKKEILDPLMSLYPGIVKKFHIFETTVVNPETIHGPFLKAIAKHVGIVRIDFDKLADWIREHTKARCVLVTDHQGLLIGESYTGEENSIYYAAFVAKIFSATEDFCEDLEIDGIKIVILEEKIEKYYNLISRINCSKKDYLALFIVNPMVQIGMARLINKRGLEKLKHAYDNYAM